MTAIPATKLVTIFGGSGFLGRHVVRALANDGWRIRVAVRRPNSAYFLKTMGRVGQIQIVKTNVLDEPAVHAALKGADAAVNLVGIIAKRGRQRFDTIHIEAAQRIGEAAAAQDLKSLVHVSALGATKNAPAHYYRSKAVGEERIREAYPSVTVLRPSLMFGPEDNFFNRFAAFARMAPLLPLIGGGHTRVQPVFVGDVARAVAKAVSDPVCAGKTYELGGPETMTFKEIMELVLRQINRKRALVTVPFWFARIKGAFLGLVPNPILTVDQVRMLETDTVVSDGALTFRDLNIMPEAAEGIVATYLWRFRKEGEFETVPG